MRKNKGIGQGDKKLVSKLSCVSHPNINSIDKKKKKKKTIHI